MPAPGPAQQCRTLHWLPRNRAPSCAELQASLTEEQQARARDSEHSISRRKDAEAAQQQLQEAMQTQVDPPALPVSPACNLLSGAAYRGLQDAVEGSLLSFACKFHCEDPEGA